MKRFKCFIFRKFKDVYYIEITNRIRTRRHGDFVNGME